VLVGAARGEALAVTRPAEAADAAPVLEVDLVHLLAGLRVPQADGLVQARPRPPPALRAVGGGRDPLPLPPPPLLLLARSDIPEDDVAVEAGRRQRLAVGAEADARHGVLVSLQ